jgi:hypothetical protein
MRDAGHDETDGARLRERYGPWAVIAGASEGMGAEYARMLAEQGLNCVLVSGARRCSTSWPPASRASTVSGPGRSAT